MGRQYFGISDKALGGNVSSTIQLHTYVCAYILYMHVSVYTIYTARHSLNSQRSHQTALCKRNAGVGHRSKLSDLHHSERMLRSAKGCTR